MFFWLSELGAGVMPAWVRPGDVLFDHGAADVAIGAVASFRFTLAGTWVAEEAAAEVALGRWQGRTADAFSTSLRARRLATEDADRQLLRLQQAIEDGVDDALVEQSRVESVQRRWDSERRAEIVALNEDETDIADATGTTISTGTEQVFGARRQ